MLFKIFFIAALASTASAFRLGNGCHWWLIAIVCKGPAQQGTPVVAPPPPPPVSCATCSAPPCPASCPPGLTPAQLAAGQSACSAPQFALYGSSGNVQCCGPAYDTSAIQIC